MNGLTRPRLLWAPIILGFFSGLVLFHHRLSTNGDNLDYMWIASAVLRGDYLNPFHWRFPVGYPYFVAAILGATGFVPHEQILQISSHYFLIVKLVGVLLLIPSLLFTFRWLVAVDAPHPLALTACVGTSQAFICTFSVVGSESLFVLCSMLALYLWERLVAMNRRVAVGPADRSTWRWGWAIGAGLATLAAIQVRQIGLAIPMAALLHAVVSGAWRDARWRKLLVLSAVLPMVISLALMLATNPLHLAHLASQQGIGDHSQETSFGTLARVVDNLTAYQSTAGQILLQKVLGDNGLLRQLHLRGLELPVAWASLLLVLYGLALIMRGRNSTGLLSILYAAISVAILLLWPFQAGRFFMPLIPLIMWLAYYGLFQALHRSRRAFSRAPILLLALLIIWQSATNGFAAVKNVANMWRWRQQPLWFHERYLPSRELDFADLLECGEWLMKNSEAKAVVVSAKALFIQVSSGRMADYPPGLALRLEQARGGGQEVYVVVDSFPVTSSYGRMKQVYLLPEIAKNEGQFEFVHRAPYGGAVVLRYHPAGMDAIGTADDGGAATKVD